MKKIISLASAIAIALSIPASAVDVYKNADLGATVTLPAKVSVNGSQQNVTWEITKFSTATEGIITIPGYVTDNPEVKVDYHISVTEGASSVSATEVKVLSAEKKVKIIATASEEFSGKASAVIYAKDVAPVNKPNFADASAVQSIEVDEESKATFEFDLKDFASGEYVCYVTAGGKRAKSSFNYVNYDDFVAAVTNISGTDADKDTKLLALYSDYSILIELQLQSVYDAMTDDEKKRVFGQLPEKLAEVEGTVALTEILDKTDEIIAVLNLYDATDKQSIIEHSTLPYADILELDIATDSYYDKLDNKAAFYSYFLTKDLSSKQKAMQNFYDGVAICSVNEADRTNIEKTLRDFNKVGEIDVLNITDELNALDKLPSANKDSVLAQFVLINNFTSTSQIKTKLNELVSLYTNAGRPSSGAPSAGGGSGGGGKGSAGGGLGGFGGLASVADTAKAEEKFELAIFDDISEAEWARPYVNKLSSLGIISGYNNKIRPNDPITREEVAKLLVLSIEANADGNINFEDVPSSEWFYEYVNRLYATGIIKGISDNQFGTGMNITREDMATMVYRAMLWKNVTDETLSSDEAFSDDIAISDYAKNAVYKLKELGIVSGVGENQFMPKGICSRAMIFKVLAEAFFN